MNAADMIFAARRAQQLTGKSDATVAFIVPVEWHGPGKLVRLAGNRGPYGRAVKDCPHGVLCRFKANGVLAYVAHVANRRSVGFQKKRRAWK